MVSAERGAGAQQPGAILGMDQVGPRPPDQLLRLVPEQPARAGRRGQAHAPLVIAGDQLTAVLGDELPLGLGGRKSSSPLLEPRAGTRMLGADPVELVAKLRVLGARPAELVAHRAWSARAGRAQLRPACPAAPRGALERRAVGCALSSVRARSSSSLICACSERARSSCSFSARLAARSRERSRGRCGELRADAAQVAGGAREVRRKPVGLGVALRAGRARGGRSRRAPRRWPRGCSARSSRSAVARAWVSHHSLQVLLLGAEGALGLGEVGVAAPPGARSARRSGGSLAPARGRCRAAPCGPRRGPARGACASSVARSSSLPSRSLSVRSRMNTCHRPSSPSMPGRTVSAAGNSRPERCRASSVSSRASGVGVTGPAPGAMLSSERPLTLSASMPNIACARALQPVIEALGVDRDVGVRRRVRDRPQPPAAPRRGHALDAPIRHGRGERQRAHQQRGQEGLKHVDVGVDRGRPEQVRARGEVHRRERDPGAAERPPRAAPIAIPPTAAPAARVRRPPSRPRPWAAPTRRGRRPRSRRRRTAAPRGSAARRGSARATTTSGATASTPSASALHQRSQLSANETSKVCAATAPADSATSAVATADPITSALTSRSPPEPEAAAHDALDQDRAQQALGAARDSERHAQLERAARVRVGAQAAEPGAERQRRPQLPRRHQHHAEVHAACRPQHGDADIARERARELGGHEVEGCEGRGCGDEPELGGGGPRERHLGFHREPGPTPLDLGARNRRFRPRRGPSNRAAGRHDLVERAQVVLARQPARGAGVAGDLVGSPWRRRSPTRRPAGPRARRSPPRAATRRAPPRSAQGLQDVEGAGVRHLLSAAEPRALRAGLPAPVLAGEKAAGKREVRQDPEPVALAGGHHVGLELARQQAVLVLEASRMRPSRSRRRPVRPRPPGRRRSSSSR